MSRSKPTPNEEPRRLRPPAKTPEGRERQLVSAAVDLAEKQILDGTVSAQVLTHYLKLGSSRERLEQSKMEQEVKLAQAKIEQLASVKKIEELYTGAIEAMRRYGGDMSQENYDDFEGD